LASLDAGAIWAPVGGAAGLGVAPVGGVADSGVGGAAAGLGGGGGTSGSAGTSSHSVAIVITAAEEDGTLHAIDPSTGKTLWTRKVKTSPWTEDSFPKRSLLCQAGDGVLVPDQPRPTQLEWVDATSGKSLWTVRPDAQLGQVAFGKGLVLLGSGSGCVTALARETGQPAWEADLGVKFKRADYHMALAADPAGRRLYAAVDGTVWALDATSGRTLWQWTWQVRKEMNPPLRPYHPVPKLYPVDDGLFALVGWSEEVKDGGPSPDHTDIVRFTADGTVVLHETSPSERSAFDAFIAGNRLALRKGAGQWEIWEFIPAAPQSRYPSSNLCIQVGCTRPQLMVLPRRSLSLCSPHTRSPRTWPLSLRPEGRGGTEGSR